MLRAVGFPLNPKRVPLERHSLDCSRLWLTPLVLCMMLSMATLHLSLHRPLRTCATVLPLVSPIAHIHGASRRNGLRLSSSAILGLRKKEPQPFETQKGAPILCCLEKGAAGRSCFSNEKTQLFQADLLTFGFSPSWPQKVITFSFQVPALRKNPRRLALRWLLGQGVAGSGASPDESAQRDFAPGDGGAGDLRFQDGA